MIGSDLANLAIRLLPGGLLVTRAAAVWSVAFLQAAGGAATAFHSPRPSASCRSPCRRTRCSRPGADALRRQRAAHPPRRARRTPLLARRCRSCPSACRASAARPRRLACAVGLRGPGEVRAAVLDPHAELAAGKADRRRADSECRSHGDRARARRARLPHPTLPDARLDLGLAEAARDLN